MHHILNELILPASPPAADTFQITSFPSAPLVLTFVTFSLEPSYGRTLVIVFWWTVSSSLSEPELAPGMPGALVCPRISALRNVLNAALFRRPTGDAPMPETSFPDSAGATQRPIHYSECFSPKYRIC